MAQGDVTYVEDHPAMVEFLGWEGSPGQDFERRMKTLAYRARSSAPRRTGRLAGSIEWKRGVSNPPNFLEGVVGVHPGDGDKAGVALWMHQGTKPHFITAKTRMVNGKPRPGYLRFMVGGQVVYRRQVWHPGTTARPYLTRWLREFVN